MNEPEITITIPTYNAENTIAQTLVSIVPQLSENDRVIVVNNRSTDKTESKVERLISLNLWDEQVSIAQAFESQGLNYTRNVGINLAKTEYVGIIDSDDTVQEGWLHAMKKKLADFDVVTGSLNVTELNPPSLAFSRGRQDPSRPPMFLGVLPFASGGNMVAKKSTLLSVGGFDIEADGIDDVLMGLKLYERNIKVGYAPDAVLNYRYHPGLRNLFRKGYSYGAKRPLLGKMISESDIDIKLDQKQALKAWGWMALNLPNLRTAAGRNRYAWTLGNRLGRIAGSVRYRHLLL